MRCHRLVDAKLAVLQIERVEFVEAAVDHDERAIVGGQAEPHIPQWNTGHKVSIPAYWQ